MDGWTLLHMKINFVGYSNANPNPAVIPTNQDKYRIRTQTQHVPPRFTQANLYVKNPRNGYPIYAHSCTSTDRWMEKLF